MQKVVISASGLFYGGSRGKLLCVGGFVPVYEFVECFEAFSVFSFCDF